MFQISTEKLDFKAKAASKVGSLDNAKHKPGGGNVAIKSEKLNFKEKAASKLYSRSGSERGSSHGGSEPQVSCCYRVFCFCSNSWFYERSLAFLKSSSNTYETETSFIVGKFHFFTNCFVKYGNYFYLFIYKQSPGLLQFAQTVSLSMGSIHAWTHNYCLFYKTLHRHRLTKEINTILFGDWIYFQNVIPPPKKAESFSL